MTINLSALQKQRRDTAANWTTENPTLLAGEIGIESDTDKIKIGNGSSAWNALAYKPWSQLTAYPIVNADVATSAAIAGTKISPNFGSQNVITVGKLLAGTTSAITEQYAGQARLQIATTDTYGVGAFNYTNDASACVLTLGKSRSTSPGNHAIVEAEDNIGVIRFQGSDGVGFKQAANIAVQIDGPPGTNDMPGRIVLSTSSDNTDNPAERLRITSTGRIQAASLGTAAAPVWSFLDDPNTGIYSPGADQVSVATGGTERLRIDASGQIEAVSLGTAAAPTFSWTGDPNTGIYSPGADQVAISTGGSGRLFVDASGRVGVNTASPQRALHSSGGVSDNCILATSIAGNAFIGFADVGTTDQTGLSVRLGSSGNSLVFQTGGTSERLRITSAGLVGIGTSSPGTLLNVAGGVTRLTNGAKAASNTYLQLYSNDASNQMALEFNNSTNAYWSIQSVENGISFKPLVLNASGGNVGIGTTSPGYLLDVAGTTRIGAATGDATLEIGAGASANRNAYIDLVGDTTYTDYGTRIIRQGGGANADSRIQHRGTGALALETAEAGAAIAFIQQPGERARIDSSGRLLVGTSSDSGGALLQVNDDRIRVATAKTPASATAAGTAGEICWDASYIYVCTATNTWKRTAISTW